MLLESLLATALLHAGALPLDKGDPKVLHIGIVPGMMDDKSPRLGEIFAPNLAKLVKEYTGYRSVILKGLDPFTSAKQLDAKKWHIGVFPAVEYAWIQKQHPDLKALMVVITDETALQAVLVGRRGSAIKGFADLKGKDVAILEAKLHCRLFADRGVPTQPRSTFAKFFSSKNGHEAIEDVLTDKVKAAIVDTPALALYKDLYPGRFKQLSLLAKSKPFPPAVVVYRDGALSPDLLKRFHNGMAKVNKSTKGKVELENFGILRFQAVPKDYQKQLTEIAKAYPPPQ